MFAGCGGQCGPVGTDRLAVAGAASTFVCPLQELLSVMPVLLPGLPAMAGLALSIGAGCCAWGSALVLLGDADTRMLAHKLRTKLQGDSRS